MNAGNPTEFAELGTITIIPENDGTWCLIAPVPSGERPLMFSDCEDPTEAMERLCGALMSARSADEHTLPVPVSPSAQDNATTSPAPQKHAKRRRPKSSPR